MPETVRYRLDVGNRELLLERLREQLGIEKERWRADVLDAALVHLDQSLEAMDELRGEVNPEVLKALSTDVVDAEYRTSLKITAADTEDWRP